MVFHWSSSDSESLQVSRILLSILAAFNNAVVWMVSARPPPSKSSSPFNNPLVTVPKAPITIRTIVTFMIHFFFQFSGKVEVLILLFTFFQFYSVVSLETKVEIFANSLFFFFLLIIIRSGLLVFWPRLGDPCVCQSPIEVCVCHFLGQVRGCAYITTTTTTIIFVVVVIVFLLESFTTNLFSLKSK